jgi:modulator of FtsH protease
MNAEFAAWANFFVAEVGASAALVGLLFVAVSINLTRILQFAHLPSRAAEALLAFLSVLAIATLGLVPALSSTTFGIAIAAIGACTWLANTIALTRTWKVFAQYGVVLRLIFNQVPPLLFVVAGVLSATSCALGLWLVLGTLASFASGVFGAWVLLIEIQR